MYTRILAGRVSRVSSEARMLTVVTEDASIGQVQALFVPALLGTMLGIRASYLPPEGSQVLVAIDSGTKQAYALGDIPYRSGGDPQDFRTALYGANYSKAATTDKDGERFKYRSGLPPLDLIEGEIDMTNVMDVGVSFLTGMARLKASEAAVVEACLLDGLVRIVSRNYEHVSPFGEFKIVTDGDKCTAEFHGTSHEHETLGLESAGDIKASLEASQPEHPDPIEAMENKMRSRLHAYAGWLGDFVSMWVTDAPKQVDGMLQYLTKSRMQFCQDGSLIVQSLADISLERVYRIPIAVREKRPEDPTGDSNFGEAVSPLSREWMPSGSDTAFHAAYQMREYARWLANDYSMSRFRALSKDFRIIEPDDDSQPDSFYHAGEEKDKAQGSEIAQVYACFRILRTGEIVIISGDHSSVVMAGGSIHVSAAKNMRLEAAGNLELVGKNVRMYASRDMELTAGRGFVASANLWFKGLCTQGGMLLKSLRPTDSTDTGWPVHTGVSNQDIPDEHKIDGVVIQSRGKLTLSGDASVVITSLRDIFMRCYTVYQHVLYLKLIDLQNRIGVSLSSSGESAIHGGLKVLRSVTSAFLTHVQEIRAGSTTPHKNHVGQYIPSTGNYEDEFTINNTQPAPPAVSELNKVFSFGTDDQISEMLQSHTQREIQVNSDDYTADTALLAGEDQTYPVLRNPQTQWGVFNRGITLSEGGRGNADPASQTPQQTVQVYRFLKDPE